MPFLNRNELIDLDYYVCGISYNLLNSGYGLAIDVEHNATTILSNKSGPILDVRKAHDSVVFESCWPLPRTDYFAKLYNNFLEHDLFQNTVYKILSDTSVGLILGDASSFAERVLGVLTPSTPEAIVVDIAKRNLVPLAMFKIFIQPRKLPGNDPLGATNPCLVILAVLHMVVCYLR